MILQLAEPTGIESQSIRFALEGTSLEVEMALETLGLAGRVDAASAREALEERLFRCVWCRCWVPYERANGEDARFCDDCDSGVYTQCERGDCASCSDWDRCGCNHHAWDTEYPSDFGFCSGCGVDTGLEDHERTCQAVEDRREAGFDLAFEDWGETTPW